MAQQINEITQKSLLYKFKKDALKEADKLYTYNHFRIGNKANKYKTNALMILIDVMENDNCEVQEFLDEKLKGCLEKDDVEIADLKTIQKKHKNVTVIVNKTGFFWENNVEW